MTGYAGIGKPNAGGTRNRFLGILSYKTQQITLGAEYAATKDSNTTVSIAEVTGGILSAFGVYKLSNSKAAVIARVDVLDPNTDVGNNKQTRVIGGVSYQATPNLRLLGDVDLLSFEGASTPLQDATRQRALFQMQFTF